MKPPMNGNCEAFEIYIETGDPLFLEALGTTLNALGHRVRVEGSKLLFDGSNDMDRVAGVVHNFTKGWNQCSGLTACKDQLF
jgi:hypothetical protein